ncbi:hypothetical protein K7W42_15315 [Deinococcus sp. HMF7604]|uniref:hypothetical protein n=1 Tax=Deinococcus betulae TaxID=2873312 RepID=UPI001CCEF39A|nr:hypothetical protein [Deinococcus betulae]MBZ9752223.1 hypothetical protein [Deinococcus betulae]
MRRLGLTVLTVSVLLSACTPPQLPSVNPDQPITTAPTAPRSLGLMEVSFTGVGTDLYASSVRSLDGELTGQALTSVAQGLQLKFGTKGSFDVGTAGNGTRYLYATYEVRNAGVNGVASTTARSNLTFVAVDASSPETISGTAVRNFKKFDGSNADAALAARVIPTVGLTQGNGTLTVNASQADFQALTTAEASSIGLPTGVRDVFQYGFVVRNKSGTSRTLPANPGANQYDGQVTFAVKLPLQANAQNDPYSFSLVFEVVEDSANRVTRVPEETVAQAQSRGATLGASQVNANTVCRVRVAGPANGPVSTLYGLGVNSSTPGSLDTCFGTGGRVTTDIAAGNNSALAALIQADGKIVAAGQSVQATTGTDLALIRYLPDGSLDGSFNNSGSVTTAVGGGTSGDFIQDIVQQPDGKLVVTGSSTNVTGTTDTDILVARYNVDGTLDTSFNSVGTVLTPAQPGLYKDFAFAVDLQTDGKIVVAGYTSNASAAAQDIVVARYTPAGALDSTFGAGGIVITPISAGTANDRARDLVIQPDGKIVILGTAATGGGTGDDTVLVRYNTNGTLDTSFGSGTGKVVTAVGPNVGSASADVANAFVRLPDGSFVVAGSSNYFDSANTTGIDVALTKFQPNGAVDTTFGTNGRVFTSVGAGNGTDVANGIEVQPDGKLVIGGTSVTGGSSGQDFLVARYNANGSLDTSFGTAGKVLIGFGASSATDIGRAVQLQGNGHIVVTGSTFLSGTPTGTDVALVRVTP